MVEPIVVYECNEVLTNDEEEGFRDTWENLYQVTRRGEKNQENNLDHNTVKTNNSETLKNLDRFSEQSRL